MSFRFINYSLADAAWNMACDEAILEAHLSGLAPPTLRLYGFQPSAVSIGLNQKVRNDLARAVEKRGLDIVRRPTGGRAVLHVGDLTYSFVGSVKDTALSGRTAAGGLLGEATPPERPPEGAMDRRSALLPESSFLEPSVLGAYKQISAGIKEALRLLGVEVEMGNAHAPYRQLEDCFMAATGSDLVYQGTKICGSAQLRRRSAVLQHGSLPLDQDQAFMSEILGVEANPEIKRHMNLFAAAGRTISFAELGEAFRRGFEKAFGVALQDAPLSAEETKETLVLRQKYLCALDFC